MKDIDMMMKCRAIYLYNIGLIYEDFSILTDENFKILLNNFLENYIESNYKIFNLIYYFQVDGDNLSVIEKEEWNDILNKYLNLFAIHDNKNIIKMYDDVGYENITKINELVSLFYNYVLIVNDMNKLRIRS